MGGLPLCRDVVGVFYGPSQLDHRTLVDVGPTPQQRSSQCILRPQPTGPQDTRWCGSYPLTEKQSVYSTGPADWASINIKKRVSINRETMKVVPTKITLCLKKHMHLLFFSVTSLSYRWNLNYINYYSGNKNKSKKNKNRNKNIWNEV